MKPRWTWRKTFLDLVIGRHKVRFSYGPCLQFWHQFKQDDGGAFAFAWLTVAWFRCVCNEEMPNGFWLYCSYHQKKIAWEK